MTFLETFRRLLGTRTQIAGGGFRIWPGGGMVDLANESPGISYEQIYEAHPTCGAVVNKLTHQIATLPLKTYTLDDKGDRVRRRDHPVDRLLSRPAPRHGAASLKQWLAFPAMVHGNGLVAKYRDPRGDGTPTELLPMAWSYISGYADEGGPISLWSTFQTGEQKFIAVDETVHLCWHATGTNGLGVSPLKQLADTVRLEDSARRYTASSFENAARPASVLIPPSGFTWGPGQEDRTRAVLQATHGGVDKAFKMALLAPGFDIKTLSHTAEQAELIAVRNINRQEIAMVYDVPPPMIGDLEHGTYSNVEELHKILYITTLRPWLVLIEETIQRQLIDPETDWERDGVFVEFDLGGVLRGNKREELDALAVAFTNGFMTLNEVRKTLNMPRIDDEAADMPHIPANNQQPIADPTDPRQAPPPPLLP